MHIFFKVMVIFGVAMLLLIFPVSIRPSHPVIRLAVFQIVAKQSAIAPEKLDDDDTQIVQALSLDGDDVEEIVEQVATIFGVDVSNNRWYHHHTPEGGCNPLWLIIRPWWMRKTHIPLRVADLIKAACTRVWSIEYPESERDSA